MFNSQGNEPIRVVPLRPPAGLIGAAAPAAAPAQLTYRNGPLLANVEVFTIFWGTAWQQPDQSGLVDQLNGFFDYILSSPLIDQLSEYSVTGYQIGYGSHSGTLNVDSPDLQGTVDDTDIQNMLQQQISNGTVPQPDANTLYFIFLPTGVTVTQGGSASCQQFCGYHDDISGNVFYAVMPFPDCSGCTGAMSNFNSLTVTVSHELCEAITDPVPGEGWYDDNNGEIGDICAWNTKTVGQYTVQQEWSNNANACV